MPHHAVLHLPLCSARHETTSQVSLRFARFISTCCRSCLSLRHHVQHFRFTTEANFYSGARFVVCTTKAAMKPSAARGYVPLSMAVEALQERRRIAGIHEPRRRSPGGSTWYAFPAARPLENPLRDEAHRDATTELLYQLVLFDHGTLERGLSTANREPCERRWAST